MSLKPAVGNQDHIRGSESASIEIVEYGDYECPHCGDAHPIIQEIQDKFGDQTRFIFRNFPLSESHKNAFPAALVAEAAALQNKFWEMHDALYENQNRLDDELYNELATKFGLDLNKFETDIDSTNLEQKIEFDFESGVRSGVNGTPSFYVNGEKFDGGAADLYQMLLESTD